jgi:DNA replication protein DnaC
MTLSTIREGVFEALGALEDGDPSPVCDLCRLVPVRWYRDLCETCKAIRIQESRRLRMSDALRTMPEAFHSWAEVASKADRRIVDALRSWTRSGGNLVLLGPSGVGKTTAVCARVRGIIDSAIRGVRDPESFAWAEGIRWVEAPALAKASRNHALGRGDAPEIGVAINATLLVLDELGYEQARDRTIADVIEQRYNRQLLTISTSGRTRAEMAQQYGDAVFRKLIATGQVIDCHGGVS